MTTELSFGNRDDGVNHDVGLPKRYLSSDGICAIEPILKPPERWPALATPKQAGIAALSVIRRCVNEVPSTGGAIINFGGDDNLAVIISSFTPQVRCHGRVGGPGILESCEGLIDMMRASQTQTSFGPVARRAEIEFWLPLTIRGGSRCVMTILTNSDQVDHTSWYRFWEAATAINAMCVRAGKAGSWSGIGELGHLSIRFQDESLDASAADV